MLPSSRLVALTSESNVSLPPDPPPREPLGMEQTKVVVLFMDQKLILKLQMQLVENGNVEQFK
jgi:hypothetical protein